MREWIKAKLKLKADSSNDEEYEKCISDLIQHEIVCSMENFIQHSDINCLQHCLYVSYSSYLICKRLGLDYRSAARGGLLHDLFLYDWHTTKQEKGMHGFTHPYIALRNSNKHFHLNKIERDIIQKHMWPLTVRWPRYKETFIVAFVDKYCSAMEIFKISSRKRVNIEKMMTKLKKQGD